MEEIINRTSNIVEGKRLQGCSHVVRTWKVETRKKTEIRHLGLARVTYAKVDVTECYADMLLDVHIYLNSNCKNGANGKVNRSEKDPFKKFNSTANWMFENKENKIINSGV